VIGILLDMGIGALSVYDDQKWLFTHSDIKLTLGEYYPTIHSKHKHDSYTF